MSVYEPLITLIALFLTSRCSPSEYITMNVPFFFTCGCGYVWLCGYNRVWVGGDVTSQHASLVWGRGEAPL